MRSTLLPFLATKSTVASTKSKVASTLLLVWTGLKGCGGRWGRRGGERMKRNWSDAHEDWGPWNEQKFTK